MKSGITYNRPPELIAAVKAAYIANDSSVAHIAKHFGIPASEFYSIRDRLGWPLRGQARKHKGFKSAIKGRKKRTPRQIVLDQRAEGDARELALYGDCVADVRLLRNRRFTVTREGDGFRVGNQRCTFAELREKAARERRLEAAARPVEPIDKGGRPKGHAKTPAERKRLSAAAKRRWRASRATAEARP